KAVKAFGQALEESPGAAWMARIIMQAARSHRMLGEYDAAFALYNRLLSNAAGSAVIGEVLYSRGLTFQAMGDEVRAREDFWRVADTHRHSDFADDCLWSVFTSCLSAGEHDQARRALQRVIDEYPDSSYRKLALLWTGKLLSAAPYNDSDAARSCFARLRREHPNTFAAARATELADELPDPTVIVSAAPPPTGSAGTPLPVGTMWHELSLLPAGPALEAAVAGIRLAMSGDPGWRELYAEPFKARAPIGHEPGNEPAGASAAQGGLPESLSLLPELLFHGDQELAMQLLNWYRARGSNYRELMPILTLMEIALHGGQPHEALAAASRLYDLWPFDVSIDLLPPLVRSSLFPDTYSDIALEASRPLNLDPWLVLAVARAESKMATGVVSWAGARGLMQFMPYTAREIAAQLKFREFKEDELLNPAVSLLLGAAYLSRLLERHGDVACAVAAYNGGEDSLARWRRGRLDATPEGFIAVIGFSETREYVQRVLFNWHEYRSLYEGDQEIPFDWSAAPLQRDRLMFTERSE
ncbi:transglycosylase SLT domain-containing protein, partial [bacterium]|nr:transglycosylase SLT domain-containing protein [candidate division CSSED10-310 bacterium]